MDGLKICPFCGSDDIGYRDGRLLVRVVCDHCGGEGPPSANDKKEARYFWNRRYKKRKGIKI